MQKPVNNYITNYLSPYLSGYRKGFGFFHKKMKQILDNKGFGGAVLMDLPKAFDTLDHKLQIAKPLYVWFQTDK